MVHTEAQTMTGRKTRLKGHRCVMERAHRGIEAHVVLIADNIHRNTGWDEMCREFSLNLCMVLHGTI